MKYKSNKVYWNHFFPHFFFFWFKFLVRQSVLPMSKQLEYFEHYKIHLRKLVGKEKAEFVVRNSIYILSMGTNDFLQNYFLDATRPNQFTVQQYQNFLVSRMSRDIEVISFFSKMANY